MQWWKRFARRVALRSIQDDFHERRLIQVSQDDIAHFALFISYSALAGAGLAQSSGTERRATLLSDDREDVQKAAPERVEALLGNVESIDWVGKDFAQDLGEIAFEWGFEWWCDEVLDYPRPLQ